MAATPPHSAVHPPFYPRYWAGTSGPLLSGALQVWDKKVLLSACCLVPATSSLMQEPETRLGSFGFAKTAA